LIATHLLTGKRLNYRSEDYKQLLDGRLRNKDSIEEMAQANLKRMDELL
jgi:hypothetical protein